LIETVDMEGATHVQQLGARPHTGRIYRTLAVVGLATMLLATACGSDDKPTTAAGGGSPTTAVEENVTLRLGYFPNLTHATAIVGVESGIFADTLGANIKLETSTFNAGPAAVEALFNGALDATYIGPNPAINAFSQSQGQAIRIISGATSGGAALVVKPEIADAAGLAGKKLATPQRGNTQDVALRAWLSSQGFETDLEGGGDVSIVPQENAQTLETFRSGAIDGAWVPEPWVSRLVNEGGGKVLVDEASLWPGGQFVTTHLIVRTAFLKDHPAAVKKLLEAQVAANDFVNANPDQAKTLANQGIEKITQKPLSAATIDSAWPKLTFTNDPVASSLLLSAKHATAQGLLKETSLDGIYDLKLLNEVLAAKGSPVVSAA
jgi:NitT/TauT family transport system substrate-binding protein